MGCNVEHGESIGTIARLGERVQAIGVRLIARYASEQYVGKRNRTLAVKVFWLSSFASSLDVRLQGFTPVYNSEGLTSYSRGVAIRSMTL